MQTARNHFSHVSILRLNALSALAWDLHPINVQIYMNLALFMLLNSIYLVISLET